MTRPQFILIDKPFGISTYDIIRILKPFYPGQKIGHAGTLDPFATGLVLVGIGSMTKKLTGLLKLDKSYTALIGFGTETDTLDRLGAIEYESKVVPSLKALTDTISGMNGELTLQVPKYSAIKHRGKPLYKYARENKSVEIPRKVMKIHDSFVHSYSHGMLKISYKVSSGTYMRSLARELGRRMGTYATILELRRTEIGDYKVDDAILIEDFVGEGEVAKQS